MEFETMKNGRNILPKRGTNSGMAITVQVTGAEIAKKEVT